MTNKTYSINETASLLAMHPDTVWRGIKKGEIEAIQVGRKYLINEDEIKRLTSGKSQKIINIFAELTQSGYSANQVAEIMSIVSKVI